MLRALEQHWPEYLIEAAGLGFFMISAGAFGTLFEYPGSPVRQAIASANARRLLMGLAMGLTAIAIIYSPWGKQSGAHINPSVTLTFFRLGKMEDWDALFYVCAQFLGGAVGILLLARLLGTPLGHPAVNYVTTQPGPRGLAIAFAAELVISFVLMSVVLVATNTRGLTRFTGLFAGLLVATYITLEAPLSGMSMNPARTFASAVPARLWNALWLYFTAPPLGMLLAAEVYVRLKGLRAVHCAKLHHDNDRRCIFRCNYKALIAQGS